MANDGIGLYATGQENLPYKAVSNGNYSEFAPSSVNTLTAEQGKKVRAYYPYSDKASGNNVPLPYTIGQSSEKPAAAFMYSEATINNNSLNFSFKHLYSYLKITLSAQQYRDNLPSGCTLEGGGLYIKSDYPVSVYDATFNLETKQITHKGISRFIHS